MRGHGLGIFKRAAGLKIGGDAGRAENVAPEAAIQAGLGGAPAHHLIGINAMHWPVGQDLVGETGRAERAHELADIVVDKLTSPT